jgi:hypothetical protein
VPNVSGNAALDVLIGLFFLYFLLSIVCSSVNEGISAVLRLRAKNLETAMHKILDGETNAQAFYDHWRVRALIKPPGRFIKVERKPSYLPSRVFALTLIDTFAPPAEGKPTKDLIGRASKALEHPTRLEQAELVRGMLQDALNDARNDVDRFRRSLERSFDDVMDRASGWYKRKVQLILFVLAIGLVGVINADSSAIAQTLWKNDALRAAVVLQANRAVQAGGAACATGGTNTTPADVAANCVNDVEQLGLPLGWTHETSPHSWQQGLGKVIGLLVTAFALTLGAPFWFDLLGKVSHLRGSGPPTRATSQMTNDPEPAPDQV